MARVTLPDVARAAGVSLGSASRALHGSGASPTMIAKVRKAADELGYQADVRGRILRSNRTFQLAFAVADIGNPVYVEMLRAIQQVVQPAGYRTVVASMGDAADSAVATIQSLRTSLVDGIIVSPLRFSDELLHELEDTTVPIVVIGRPLNLEFVDSVSTNSAIGIELAVDHLVSTGRSHLAFLNGPVDTTPGEARARGFAAAVRRHSSQIESVAWDAPDFTIGDGMSTVTAELTAAREHGGSVPDGIIAANDLLAVGAMKALGRAGIRVPGEVAVTGMDDTEIGQVVQPSLTSVSLNAHRRGELAAQCLLTRIETPEQRGQNVMVSPELRIRESSDLPGGIS